MAAAALVRNGKPERLWHGQSLLVDSYHAFAYLAGVGIRVPVGLGVSLMPLRHPFEAALQAQSLALTTGQPVVAGFGPGAVAVQERVLGAPYTSQLGAVREYTTIVRALLETGQADFAGDSFDCRAVLPRLPRPPIEVGLGVLRPAMARLAGEVADTAITWLAPASYIADVLVPELDAGARRGGRPRPRIVATVPVIVEGPGRDIVELALAGSSGHLRMPHYREMLTRSGVDVDDDLRRTAENAVAGRAIVSGTVDDVVGGLAEFAAAGVDEIVLNVTGVGQVHGFDAALEDVRTVLGAVPS